MLTSLLLFLSFGWVSADTGNAPVPTSIFDLMSHQDVLELTLETRLDHLRNNRRSDLPQEGRVVFRDAAGTKRVWHVKVNLRGAFRRIHCDNLPPMKLNFRKSELSGAGLAAFDDLKLVPLCAADLDAAADALLREFLTYRLFNAVTPYSFRVQLLQVNYIDSDNGEMFTQWAFVVEDAAQLRHRIGAEKIAEETLFNPPADRMDRDYLKTVAVFQYMIGNTDWSLSTCKNLKLMVKDGKLLAIPYDFDFTGLVNPPYFAPDSDFGFSSRNDRAFLGYPEDVEHLHDTAFAIAGKRHVLERMVRKFKWLSFASRQDMLAYLASFFDDPEVVTVPPRILADARE